MPIVRALLTALAATAVIGVPLAACSSSDAAGGGDEGGALTFARTIEPLVSSRLSRTTAIWFMVFRTT